MLKNIFFIIGTFVGAGLISGKEIEVYFGDTGLLGILLSTIIITIVILYIEKKKKIKHRNNILLDKIITISLIMSFMIMIVGMTNFLNQEFNLNRLIATILYMQIINFTLKKDITKILKINNVLVWLIIICICIGLITNVENLWKTNIQKAKNESYDLKHLIKPVAYASYNLLLIIPIIENEEKTKNNEKLKIKIIALFLIILVLLISVYFMINILDDKEKNLNIPLVIYYRKNIIMYCMYIITILSAIYTSTISLGYNIAKKIKNEFAISKNAISKMLGIVGVSTIFLNFSFCVKYLYSIFSIIGIIKIIILIIS